MCIFFKMEFAFYVGIHFPTASHVLDCGVKFNLCAGARAPAANHNVTAAPCLYKAAVFGIQEKTFAAKMPAACFLTIVVRLQTHSSFLY